MSPERISVFDECRQEVLHEISDAFIQDIKTVLDRKHSARKLLERDFSKSQVRKRIVRGKELYRVLAVSGPQHAEIIISRPTPQDRPKILDEYIRFRFNNPMIGMDRIELEYGRTLRNGGSRKFRNNTAAAAMMGGFISQMQADFVPPRG